MSNGGAPDYAVPDFFLLSPVTGAVAYIFGGSLASFKLYWFLVWVFGAWGIVNLGRHLKAPGWGICCVNAGFMFSGVYCGQAENISGLSAMSVIPWIVWRLDVALKTGRILPAFQAALLWGLSGLCSYIGLTALTGCYCVLWMAGRLMTWSESGEVHERTKRWMFGLAVTSIFGCFGLLIVSPILAGLGIELAGYSDRAGVLSRSVAIGDNVIDPRALFSFASPYVSILKMNNYTTIWPNTDTCLISIYSGAAATVLAFASLLARNSIRWRLWLFGLGLLCLMAALGYHTPVRGLLYDWFPPTRYFRHPAIFRYYWIFTISYLALYAARDIETAARSVRASRFLAAIAVFAAVIGIAWTLIACSSNYLTLSDAARFHLFAIWLLLAAACIARSFARRLSPAAIVVIACIDGALSFQMNRAIMCSEDPGTLQFWSDTEKQHNPSLNFTKTGFDRELQAMARPPYMYNMLHNYNLILKRSALKSYSPLSNEYHRKIADTPLLANAAIGENRIWFARDAPEIIPSPANFEAYKARALAINAAPIVRHTRDSLLHHANTESAESNLAELKAPLDMPAQIISYTPNALSLRVTAPAEGWLLVTERWALGWHAKVNGVETEVVPGNFIFRCIKVPAGEISVDFYYRPIGMPWLLYLSYTVILAVACISLAKWLARFFHASS